MGIGINLPQLFERGVRVDFSSRQRLVSEQFPHTLDISPMIKHCRCKRMAQHVGRLFFHCRYSSEMFFNQPSHLLCVHASAPVIYEKRVVEVWQFSISAFQILLQCCFHLLCKGHDALFIAFAVHLDLMIVKIDSYIIKSDELRESDASLIE